MIFPHSKEESNSGDDSSVTGESNSIDDSSTSMCNPKSKKHERNNAGKKLDTRQNTNQVATMVVFPAPPTVAITTDEPNDETQVVSPPTNAKVPLLAPTLGSFPHKRTYSHRKLHNQYQQQKQDPNYSSHLKLLKTNKVFKQ